MGQLTGAGRNWADVLRFLKALRNRSFGSLAAGTNVLVQATTTTRVKVNACSYMIEGVNYTKAAADNLDISALTATGAATACKVRVEIDTAGTVTFVQGTIDGPGDKIPPRSASKATLGTITMGNSFTPGTTVVTAGILQDGDPDLAVNTFYSDLSTGGLEK